MWEKRLPRTAAASVVKTHVFQTLGLSKHSQFDDDRWLKNKKLQIKIKHSESV